MDKSSRHRHDARQPLGLESVDDRMISLMRLTLALSALLIIYIDPSEPDRLVALTYGALVVYSIYGGVLYFLSLRGTRALPISISHWIDVGWFLSLVALSSGTSSIFFFFFFFAILVASFRRGFKSGLRVTVVSTLLFTLIGYATAPAGNAFELNRFLLRPVYLLVLGYMIAYWGGHEIKLKRRLNLLKEINLLANPRFGVSETVGALLERLRAFYGADDCWLILSDMGDDELRLFRISQARTLDSVTGETLPPKLAQSLLAPDTDVGILYEYAAHKRSRPHRIYAIDFKKKAECSREWETTAKSLGAQFEISTFISVPTRYRKNDMGRLFLVGRPGVFEPSDLDFLMQVMEQAMPVLQNIRLLDRLATTAAEHERERLARDLHDSVIQRYLGLQYQVAAIRNKLTQGANVSAEIDHLFMMTVNEVTGLRGFAQDLKEGEVPEAFLPAVRRFASQFSDNYNLEVQVAGDDEIPINDRLAAELIQIVQEGLSNIRKHTDATTSRICVERVNGSVALTIENNRTRADSAIEKFMPRSIAERVHELGGQVAVSCGLEDRTVVKIHIPFRD